MDKALHSLGYKYGYALPKPELPNPINIIMVQAQEVCIDPAVERSDIPYSCSQNLTKDLLKRLSQY